jgi:peroxiredoxin
MTPMARTESTMLPLGTKAPVFDLPDPDGRRSALADFADRPALLVAFICNHCPYVKHLADAFSAFAKAYAPRGLATVAINSNDVEKYPDDGPEAMRLEIARRGYDFPYLLDESQAVAKAYRAACTPDFFLFDRDRRLVYRGRFDGSRPGQEAPVTGADLRAAVDAVLADAPVPEPQLASMGCNIKWKPGQAPAYFGA